MKAFLRSVSQNTALFELFLADDGEFPRIEKMNMDCSVRAVVVSKKISLPNAISLDYVREKVYWADSKYRISE